MRTLGAVWLFIPPALANWYNGTTFPRNPVRVLDATDLCPDTCPTTGAIEAGDWSAVLSVDQLDRCTKPMLFTTSVRFPLGSERGTYIQACRVPSTFMDAKIDSLPCVAALSRNQTLSQKVDLKAGYTIGNGPEASLSQALAAAGQLQKAASSSRSCRSTILFAKVGQAVVGLYAGAEVDRTSVGKVVQEYIEYLDGLPNDTLPAEIALQACGGSKKNDAFQSAAHIVGIYASTANNIEVVHDAVGKWSQAKCVSLGEHQGIIAGKRITFLSGPAVTAAERKQVMGTSQSLQQRDDACTKYVMVQSGDSCESLASRCGISEPAFIHFNGGSGDNGEDDSFCSDLQINTPMCCTAGSKPDLSPKEGSDGTCASVIIAPDDLCADIEAKYYLKSGDLETFNVGKTWGWAGCKRLLPGQKICVSEGSPPLPTWVKNAVCGPQKPGTVRSSVPGLPLTDYNYCPLNACCDVWGQCGTTTEFCVNTTVNGTPGTAANGTDGCISNCGVDIVSNSVQPPEFMQVGYFEAWNYQRKCLHMDVTQVPKNYTHIHFAFGDISTDGNFQVSANGVEDQFRELIGLTGVKRIMSLGGWAFSNDGNTSFVLHEAVKPENRQTFANNVISFVLNNDLDGIDFDWEYPGATDIAGADPGTPEDGTNYLEMLKLVRSGLGDSKSISISTPASYWYLQNFPVLELADVLSYTVFMTYDFHGQWDVGNKYVEDGCPEGNCLWSAVNQTETFNALSMITKAGMPANKIMVGVSSYGRSFKMAEAGCYSPNCHYLGGYDESPAEPGECTETNGYLAGAEIDAILADKSRVVTSYHDGWSDSDILVYDDVQWVAYMNKDTKKARRDLYKELNFLGSSDWAVDLQGNVNDPGGNVVYIGTEVFTSPTMHCSAPCTLVLPPTPLPEPTIITIPPYTTSLEAGGGETVTVTVSPSPITTDQIPFYQITISSGEPSTPIQPYPSVSVPDATVTFTYTTGTETETSTRDVALPPWPTITNGPPPPGSSWGPPPTVTSYNASGIFWYPSDTDDLTWPTYPTTSTTTEPNTYVWSWYPGSIEPLPTSPPAVECENDCKPDPKTGLVWIVLPCDIWFFNICNGGDDDHSIIHGWRLKLPPGITLAGPPPPGAIELPKGWFIRGKLPPLPKIKIPDPPTGGNKPTKPEFPDEEPDDCETESASICGTTTSYAVSASGASTVTTASSTYSTCYTVYGCEEQDDGSSTVLAATASGCSAPSARRRRAIPTPAEARVTVSGPVVTPTELLGSLTGTVSRVNVHVLREEAIEATPDAGEDAKDKEEAEDDFEDSHYFEKRDDCDVSAVIVVPNSIFNANGLYQLLQQIESDLQVTNLFHAAGGIAMETSQQYYAWFYLPITTQYVLDRISQEGRDELALIFNPQVAFDGDSWCQSWWENTLPPSNAPEDVHAESNLTKRDDIREATEDWGNAFMSQPREQRVLWHSPNFYDETKAPNSFVRWMDESAGDGQIVYVIDNFFTEGLTYLPEFVGAKLMPIVTTPVLYEPPPLLQRNTSLVESAHGDMVLSQVVGQTLGGAPKATVYPIEYRLTSRAFWMGLFEAYITVLEHIRTNGFSPGNIVVSATTALPARCIPVPMQSVITQILQLYSDSGIVIVSSAGNFGPTRLVVLPTTQLYPQASLQNFDNVVIAGSADIYGYMSGDNSLSQVFSDSDFGSLLDAFAETAQQQTFAPGVSVRTFSAIDGYKTNSGTSFASPRIAALLAYYRGVPGPYQKALESSANVLQAMDILKGTLIPGTQFIPPTIKASFGDPSSLQVLKTVWNGQAPDGNGGSESCLLTSQVDFVGCLICPEELLDFLPGVGGPAEHVSGKTKSDAPACQLPGPSGTGGDIGGVPVPGPIVWSPGTPGPLCEKGCGTACNGYYCSLQPTGPDPDFVDPDPPPSKTSSSPPPPARSSPSGSGSGGSGGGSSPVCVPGQAVTETCITVTPDFGQNEVHCYGSGQASNNQAINIAVQDFCKNDVSTVQTWSNKMIYNVEQPQGDNYYFALSFEVYEGCSWDYDYDVCVRFLSVAINSCNCDGTGHKQGGYVTNNCMNARVDPQDDIQFL